MFHSLLILKDLRNTSTDNSNVNRVRLAVARAEIYRKEKGLGIGLTFSNRKTKSLEPSKDVLRPIKIDHLPMGPLNLLKIRHNDVLDRYLNNKVRVMITVKSFILSSFILSII